jgi:hypothetical protein
MFGGVGFSWLLWLDGPPDSREVILQREFTFNFSLIEARKLRHSDTISGGNSHIKFIFAQVEAKCIFR